MGLHSPISHPIRWPFTKSRINFKFFKIFPILQPHLVILHRPQVEHIRWGLLISSLLQTAFLLCKLCPIHFALIYCYLVKSHLSNDFPPIPYSWKEVLLSQNCNTWCLAHCHHLFLQQNQEVHHLSPSPINIQ